MATATPIPTLEEWNNSPYKKLDYQLHCMLTSEASQSNFFKGSIHSIQFQLSKYKNNEALLRTDMIDILTAGLTPYFDQVQVDVTIEELEDNEGKLNVTLNIQLQQDSKSYSARRLAYMVDSKFVKVVTINNG